jgi:transposase-like protein
MNRNSSPFKWRHYAPDVILLCVRWYCRFQLSYRDVEEMMKERGKYLNNVIEQDHRFIKKKVRASQCFKRFHTAERTLEGIEAINMIRKGQVKRLAGSDSQGQAKFVASLFGVAA